MGHVRRAKAGHYYERRRTRSGRYYTVTRSSSDPGAAILAVICLLLAPFTFGVTLIPFLLFLALH